MKGILFKPDMIQATAEGSKTNTRRVEKALEEINLEPDNWILGGWDSGYEAFVFYKKPAGSEKLIIKPRYQVGETVYVKEAWEIEQIQYPTAEISYVADEYGHDNCDVYIADKKLPANLDRVQSPLFMPEWAARYFLMIADVKAERLQEITIHGISKEGIQQDTNIPNWHLPMREKFIELWNSINKDYPWESNLWIFAYTFRQEGSNDCRC